jgi:hypothetical protein
VLIALILNSSGFAVEIDANSLRIARVIVVLLSGISLIVPWVLRRHLLTRQSAGDKSSLDLMPVGLVLSNTPVIYGFALFMFSGSLLELCTLAGASLISASVWYWYMLRKRDEQPVN